MTMKVLILAGVLFALSHGAVFAQKTVRLNSTPKAFRTFFANFKNAVAKGNRQAVAAMTRFPFQWGFDAGDEGTWSRSQFIRNYDKVLTRREVFLTAKNPTFYAEGGTYNFTDESDASHYIFKKHGSTYKFTAYIVEP
jgi:hypothetical protein